MEPWKCNECDWRGPRHSVDAHIRTMRHGCSPVPNMKPCPNCNEPINAGSLYCSHCKTQLVEIKLPPRPY